MSFGLENLGMLLGLAALAIPVLIHFLKRRRFDVVDWGAMQFLQVAPNIRRRWWWDELLLLLIRLGLVAILVLALASPFLEGPLLGDLPVGERDVIYVLDASASMARPMNDGSRTTLWHKAKELLDGEMAKLGPGERAGLIVAGQPPRLVQADPTADVPFLRGAIALLPEPAGSADLPRALELAREALARSRDKADTEIVVVRDRQKAGWADADTLARWERLATHWRAADAPRLRVLEVDGADQRANLWLTPLETGLATVAPGQKLAFTTTLHWRGPGDIPDKVALSVTVDGEGTDAWHVSLDKTKGAQPIAFSVRLETAGRHLVSLRVATDPADALKEDNEQHFVVEAIKDLPVLLVDGDKKIAPTSSTYFLRQALRDDSAEPLFGVQALPVHDFSRDSLLRDGAPRCRVCVLADVPGLSEAQGAALEDYLAAGGSVLVTLGPRAEKLDAALAWFPAKLEGIQGRDDKLDQAARIVSAGLTHPALEYFADPKRGLDSARFPRWHALTPDKEATAIAFLDDGMPFLIEKRVGRGRVIVCAAPLDGSWKSDFTKLQAFPLFVHQLMLYLADSGGVSWRLASGEALRYLPASGAEVPTTLVLKDPDGKSRAFVADAWPWLGPRLTKPGAYGLSHGLSAKTWFVLPPDLKEADFTEISKVDEDRITAWLPWGGKETAANDGTADREAGSVDVWWMLLIAVMVLLCLEIWFTRRMALQKLATP